MIHNLLTIDSYSAFLSKSGFEPNQQAVAFMPYKGKELEKDFESCAGVGLIKDGKLTTKGQMIARVICQPLHSVIASNSSFGDMPLCFYSFGIGFWIFVTIEPEKKIIDIFSPIYEKDIKNHAKDALFGNWESKDKEPFSLTLTPNEVYTYNLVLCHIANKAKKKGEPLTKEEAAFSIDELFNESALENIATISCLLDNEDIKEFFKNPELVKEAFIGLFKKSVIETTEDGTKALPGIVLRKHLAPSATMMTVSYSDTCKGSNHKYYVFPESMLEITCNEKDITFTKAFEPDFSPWNVEDLMEQSKEDLDSV